jgi:hypothetical protein
MKGATLSLIESIKIKKDYEPAYIQLSRYLLERGEKSEAEKILELGLEQNPGSTAIRDELARVREQKASDRDR